MTDYTEEQYNSFGWASEAGALLGTEIDDLYAKIQARKTLRTFRQSSKGEAIIEVNKKPHTTLDVDNVFVFVKGKKDNFYITRVVRFNAETETEMEIIKEELYDGRSWSDSYCAFLSQEGLAKEYRRENSKSFEQYQQEARRRGGRQTSRRTNQNNRGRAKYRSGYSLTVGENGEIIEKNIDIDSDTRHSLKGIDPYIDEIFTSEEAAEPRKNDGTKPVIKTGTVTSGVHAKQAANLSKEKMYTKEFSRKEL